MRNMAIMTDRVQESGASMKTEYEKAIDAQESVEGWNAGESRAPQIPEGYKLVPIEPTEEMINAAIQDGTIVDGKPVWKHNVVFQVKWRYQAMLEAAPEVKVDKENAEDTND